MTSKRPGTGTEIEATASNGGVQENFSNEGDGSRIKATADGGTQRGFVNKSGSASSASNTPSTDGRKGWIHSPGGAAIISVVGAIVVALIGGYFLLKSSENGKEIVVAPSPSLIDAGVTAERPQP